MSKRFITGEFSFIGAVIYATQLRTFFANCLQKTGRTLLPVLFLMEVVNQYALSWVEAN